MLPLSGDKLLLAGIFYNAGAPFYSDVFLSRLFADEVSGLTALESDPGFSIEPNPCRDFARVSFPSEAPKGATALLRDGQGRCLASWKLENDGALEIPTSKLAPGTYWLEVGNEEGHRAKALVKIE